MTMTERRRKPQTVRQRAEPYAVVGGVIVFWAVVALAIWKVAS